MQLTNGNQCSTGFPNEQGTGRPARRIVVTLIMLFPVLALADEPPPKPSSPASQTEVPAALLARLRTQYISEETKTSDVSERDKIRRYEAILREGGRAERQYARAANLHAVRELMMATAKDLATLEGTAEARQLVFDIARRLANSSAPPESRVVAEMLLMRERIDELTEWPAEAADEVATFAARYRGTPGESTALMSAAHLCRLADGNPARHVYLRQLSEKYFSVPGVSAFLEAEGVNPYLGRLMTAKLVRLDGSTLEMPRDTLGKFTVVHFWTMEKSDPAGGGAKGLFDFMPLYQFLQDVNLTFVGVNLNTDRARVVQSVGDPGDGMNRLQTCSGLGSKDPTFLRYQSPTLPAYWLVGPDGCIISNNYARGEQQPWPRYSNGVRRAVSSLGQMAVRMPYYRSGEFLLDLSGLAPTAPASRADVPAERLDELQRKVVCPPALGLEKDKKAAVFREAMELGRSIEKEHPRAANLLTVSLAMLVAARWLATENGAWQKVEGACWRKPGFDQDDDHPVVCVSWNDAVAFCQWLERTSGKTVGLPTEARWEYACRAGTDTVYCWGNRPEEGNKWCNAADRSVANKLSGFAAFPWDDGYPFTSPSGKFKANAFGLYDMSGNAWQWCADWYDQDSLQEPKPHIDLTGPPSGTYRVTCGGSWHSGPDHCRAAVRRKELPAARTNILGFRVVVETPYHAP